MKKSTFLTLSMLLSATLLTPVETNAFAIGWTTIDPVEAHLTCWNSPAVGTGACMPDLPYATIWTDPFVAAATLLDAMATEEQQTKTIDAEDALDQLEDALKSDDSSSSCSGASSETTCSVEDIEVLVPEIVVNAVETGDEFDSVRKAVEDYVFTNKAMNGDCKAENPDCANQRQETWTFLSVAMAEAAMDKVITQTNQMNFSGLADTFNGQTSPAGMWGGMSAITLDTQNQANDLNMIYARDLEMNALMGISESGVEKIDRSGSSSDEEE